MTENDVRALTGHLGLYVHTNREFEDSIRHKRDVLRRRDEVIAGCMSEAGFQYFPDPPEVVISFFDGFTEERNTRDWAEVYGFGITTLRFRAGAFDHRIVGYPGSPPPVPADSDEESDPFNNYLESLGEDGQSEYWIALYGIPPGSTGFSEEMFLASCAGRAEVAIPEFESTENVELAAVDVDDLLDRARASPEFLNLEQLGARCLRNGGHDVGSEVEARGEILEAESTMNDRFGFIDDRSSLSGRRVDDFVQAMQNIQRQEIDAAVAVWDCGVAEPQLRAVLGELVVTLYEVDG